MLRAIFDKLLSLDAVSRAPELYDLYRKNVEISLSLNDVASLIAMAPQLSESGQIRRYTIGRQGQVVGLYRSWLRRARAAAKRTGDPFRHLRSTVTLRYPSHAVPVQNTFPYRLATRGKRRLLSLCFEKKLCNMRLIDISFQKV